MLLLSWEALWLAARSAALDRLPAPVFLVCGTWQGAAALSPLWHSAAEVAAVAAMAGAAMVALAAASMEYSDLAVPDCAI